MKERIARRSAGTWWPTPDRTQSPNTFHMALPSAWCRWSGRCRRSTMRLSSEGDTMAAIGTEWRPLVRAQRGTMLTRKFTTKAKPSDLARP